MKTLRNTSWRLLSFVVLAFVNSACVSVKPNDHSDKQGSEKHLRGVYIVALIDSVDTEKDSTCAKAFSFEIVSAVSGKTTKNLLCLKDAGDVLKDTKYALVFDVGLSSPVSEAIVSSMRLQTVYPLQPHYRFGVCRDSSIFFRRPGILTEEIVSVADGKYEVGLLGLYYQSNTYWGVLELGEVLDHFGLKPIGLNGNCHESER